MRIARSLDQAAGWGPSALTIGNFDGVHIGHQHLFRELVNAARARSLMPTVLTFDPHPARIVAPARAPRLLTSAEDRCALMADLGIEQVLVLPFTAEVAALTPEQFIRSIVVEAVRARIVMVGDNFRFGHKQAGDTGVLSELGARNGYETRIVGAVKCRGRIVSSSAIREFIDEGNVALVGRLLNRAYSISGEIVSGHGVGSKQTVPTLNLKTDAEILPRNGVYVTRTNDLQSTRQWASITNIGHRPTFGGGELSIETFVLDPFEAVPERIRLEFLRRVRDERKFDDPAALKSQILRDVGRANAYSRRLARWRRPH
jgi:riboflavin kinase / FMN adenylyltransferase